MKFQSKYTAKTPNEQGLIHYTQEENAIWALLFNRQMDIVKNRACNEFILGLASLEMSADHIPQCLEMNSALKKTTGWRVKPVEAIIPADEFFSLLAERIFPAAAFIRSRDELDYLQEPDIVHEFFGHCPMLTDTVYADFMQNYGKIALNASETDREYLARFYWFTVEFGLINTLNGLRIYGGGILSSKEESIYSLESDIAQRKPLADGLEALRTPYRIDILQPIYYVINSYQEIYDIMQNDIIGLIHQAQDLGDFAPIFEQVKPEQRDVKC
ncbi:MAG: phenylalanine 4-monooxygenase [Legionellales bacterium]|nr:phenylalanine 4-monooxygenase [Legionellales bacterium]